MTSHADKGQAAFKAGNYEESVQHFTQALKTSQSPLWLISRSTAYQRLGKHDLALADADAALLAARARARREQMATAQFRRAVALHGLKRYGDARLCLSWTRKFNEKEKALGIWQARVAADYERAEKEGKVECLGKTVLEFPVIEEKVEEVKEIKKVEKENTVPAKVTAAAATAATAASLQQTPREKIKHDWYQSTTTITISIIAKGVPKDRTTIDIQEGSLEVSFPTTDSTDYSFTLSPLFARVDTSASQYRITPHKIEITLHKSAPGQKWANLEGTEPTHSTSDTAPSETTTLPPPATVLASTTSKGPVYPTSSRTGPKDWEKLGEEGDDDPESEGVDAFFKKLYQGSDPDTQKAMMKSYQESNGTSLSTNWGEVSKKRVEIQPPEGVVAKKWGE